MNSLDGREIGDVNEREQRQRPEGGGASDEREERRLRPWGIRLHIGLAHLSKAARLARSDEDANEPTPASLETMRGKFPLPRTDISLLNDVPADAPHFLVDEEVAGQGSQASTSSRSC